MMGMLRGGTGLFAWRDGWKKFPCPLARVDFLATQDGTISAVDDGAHQLWHGGRVLPCDREIAALALWRNHALTLSGDTDCLAIADREGWLRTVRVGVYPQDMAVAGDTAWVCGGADGRVYGLRLPDLREEAVHALPGMPERIAVLGDGAWVLCLRAEDFTVYTSLHALNLRTGATREVAELEGLPGAIAADGQGVWAAAGERLYHFPPEGGRADAVIEGFELIRHLDVREGAVLATDTLAGLVAHVSRGAVHVLARGDVGQTRFL